MHLKCSAWDEADKLVWVDVGVGNGMAWDPYVDQILVVADIERMVMSCLWVKKKKHFYFIEKSFCGVLVLFR